MQLDVDPTQLRDLVKLGCQDDHVVVARELFPIGLTAAIYHDLLA